MAGALAAACGDDVDLSLSLRLGRRRGAPAPWLGSLPSPPDLPAAYGLPSGLHDLYIVPADANALPVTELGDDTPSRLVLSSTSFGDDCAYDSSFMGRPAAYWNASNLQLVGASAADWKHLHGDNMTFFCVFWPRSVLSTQVLFTTRTDVTVGAPGFGFFYIGAASNHRIQANQYNDAGAAGLTLAGALGTAPLDVEYRCIMRVDSSRTPDADLWVNGNASYATGNSSGFSVANPQGPLRCGKAVGTGTNNLSGLEALWGSYQRCLSDSERDALGVKLATLSSGRTTIRVAWFGDSTTANAASGRRKLQMRAKRSQFWRLEMVGSQAPALNWPGIDGDHDGVSGETISQIATRIASGVAADDVVIMAGTNDMGGSPASALTAMGLLIDQAKARYPGARIWVLAIQYGTGSGNNTLVGNAGTYNAGLPALCAAKKVHFVDIHSGAYAWNPAIHASDTTGHPTPAGGDAVGNTLAVAMGIGGD